ncbi:MAG: acetylornithine transaminase [Nitrospirae bacterium]|nr:acetylornithine transaminase [Nitrospirota bacterium]
MKRLLDEAAKYLMNTYNRYPVVLVKGRGARVYGDDGKEYLDFVGGIAVNILGHCHPRVVVSIQKQAQRLLHVSNLYHIDSQIKLAKLLVENSFADRVFFCNSGAEANEAAIKLARKYANEHYGENRYEIITAYNSFHGRTMATITATGQEKIQKGFEPLLPGFKYVSFNDIDALHSAIDDRTCAVMLEPIQGEGGVKVPSQEYFKNVRTLCNEKGVLLILDEVQTGMGRTGRLFAYEHFGIEPDIMTLAKGLGGGVPIGAMLAKEHVASSFTPGSHASTFGGNPLVCQAAVATLETILEDDAFILKECARLGGYLKDKLYKLKEEFSGIIVDIRGIGLMVGVELTRECQPIVKACIEKGLLINCTAGTTLRFTPPLIITEEDIDTALDILADILWRLS